MDLSTYKQMPDLPDADIDFLNDLDDTLLGRPAEDYESEENMQIRQEIEDEEESEAQYQRDLREFKFKRSIF
jgi:predicted metal-dependent HD superfamily phosphohydrolase